MAGIDILAVILTIAFFLIYAILLFSIIRAGTRGTFNWFIVIFAAIIGLLLITFLIANINNIVPADWAQILILLGLVAVTAMYAFSTRQMAEEMRDQRVMASRPVVIQKVVVETETELATFGSKDWFSYFEVYNAGNGPAIEVEISLLNKEKTPIHSQRKTFLRASEPPIEFYPSELASLEKSTFYLVCEYQSIFSRGSQPIWYQTWLPFETIESSKEGKIYVKPGELEFYEVSEKERIDAFGSRSKPK